MLNVLIFMKLLLFVIPWPRGFSDVRVITAAWTGYEELKQTAGKNMDADQVKL
jgi:hypothetical protein